MSRIIDTYTVYKIIKKLTTDWEDTEAFKLGIIDDDGKVLRKYKTLDTNKEKEAYTVLDRFVFNMKRLLQKLPGGRSKFGSYAAAALLLLKEDIEDDEKELL